MKYTLRVCAVDSAGIGFKALQDIKLESKRTLDCTELTLYIEGVTPGRFIVDQEYEIELTVKESQANGHD